MSGMWNTTTARISGTLVIAAALGVFTSYAIAWGCVWFAQAPEKTVWQTEQDADERAWLVSEHVSTGYTYMVAGAWTYGVTAWEVRDPPWWSRALHNEVPVTARFQRQSEWDCEVVAGWPIVCARCDFIARRTGGGAIQLEIERGLRSSKPLPNSVPRVFPVDPIWRGLLMNSVLFGSAWLLLVVVPRTVRHWRRRRSGRCTSCGYDLRASEGSKCPECGRDT